MTLNSFNSYQLQTMKCDKETKQSDILIDHESIVNILLIICRRLYGFKISISVHIILKFRFFCLNVYTYCYQVNPLLLQEVEHIRNMVCDVIMTEVQDLKDLIFVVIVLL